MEIRQIDHLFKNKLKSATFEPKVESWDRLEAMLDNPKPKGLFWLWKVAAVVVVLLLATVAIRWSLNDESSQQLATKETQIIQKENLPETNKKEIVSKLKVEEVKTETLVKELAVLKTKVQPAIVEKKSESIDNTKVEEAIVTTNEVIEIADVSLVNSEINQVVVAKKLPVKITFIRSTDPSEEQLAMAEIASDTTSRGLKGILEKTLQLTPGELMADIRGAKDDFLSDPFNIKKNKVKNSNK